jgi:UDPglucose--hexose-1-phosphate uridylyltransferase
LKVILAPGRASRPEHFGAGDGGRRERDRERARPLRREDCPLCEGHEQMTPPESYAKRPDGGAPDSGGWLVRAVPNKYPLLTSGNEASVADPLEQGRGEPALLASGKATGAHEVIVHAPDHVTSIAHLTAAEFALVLESWRERFSEHRDAPYVHLMVNEGQAAGASLEHTHAQLYGLSFVPTLVARERERFTAHHIRTMGGCLLCDLLQEEVRRRERVISVDEHAVLLAPYASRLPYELQLVPRSHAKTIAEAAPAAAQLLLDGLHRLERALGELPPLNLWLRSAPRDAEHFHWHIDVVPRMTQLAGLELGAGLAVNIHPPERVAEELRSQ